MRKEALFAIFLGSVIGLAIAFGLMRANKALVPAKQVEATQSPTQNPSLQTEEKVAAGALLVVKPQNNAIVPTSKVSVEGSSTPNSTVVIATNGSEAVLQTSKNQIKVISFDNNGNESSTSLTVVYSTELQ